MHITLYRAMESNPLAVVELLTAIKVRSAPLTLSHLALQRYFEYLTRLKFFFIKQNNIDYSTMERISVNCQAVISFQKSTRGFYQSDQSVTPMKSVHVPKVIKKKKGNYFLIVHFFKQIIPGIYLIRYSFNKILTFSL